MSPVKIIDVKQTILDENNRIADQTRGDLKKKKLFLLNLMSSPGAGKTRIVTSTIRYLQGEFRIEIGRASCRERV